MVSKITNPQSTLYGELICNHFEFKDNLELQKGQTYDEVLNILRTNGARVESIDNLYFWDMESENKYFVFFEEDADGVLKVSSFGNDYDVCKLTVSIPYEDVCELFQSEGTKQSIDNQVYSWSFLDGNIVAEFECTDDQLLLKRHNFVRTTDFVNLSYDEICEALGTSGELQEHEYAKSTIYRWDSVLDADLFVRFNDKMIAERFSYETDIKTAVGSSYEMFKFVFGEKKYSADSIKYAILVDAHFRSDDAFSYTWETKGEFDIQAIISYDTRKVTDILYNLPRLDLNNEMTDRDICAILGEDYYIHNFPNSTYCYYCWHYGEYDLCADFTSGRGLAWILFFKKCEGHEENTE